MAKDDIKFLIKKIYAKDISLESPAAPKIFDDKTIQPKLGFNLNSSIDKVDDTSYEITLEINVKTEIPEQVIYIVEIKQSGIFIIEGASDEIKQGFLNVRCPEILFPYARENISSLILRAGFPPLFISPVDFNALYQQELAKTK
jgi:preprotein translocase subunit SecB